MFSNLNKKNKMFLTTALISLLVALMALSGCDSSTNSVDSTSAGEVPASGSDEMSSDEPENNMQEILLTYANMDYINTGDESEAKLVRNINGQLDLPGNDETAAIKATIEKLRKVPAGMKGVTTCVTSDIVVKKVTVSGDKCTVDLTGDGIYELDSYTEQFFIYQITDSILQSFKDIKSVAFTVDGAKTDSLSYMDISQPFTTADITAFDKKASAGSSNGGTDSSSSSSSSGNSSGTNTGSAADSGVTDDSDNAQTGGSGTMNGVVNDDETADEAA